MNNELLKTAIKASIPIITIKHPDILNVGTVLTEVLNTPVGAYPLGNDFDPAKVTLTKSKLNAFSVFYSINPELKANDSIYNWLVSNDKTLILVNGNDPSYSFDAGVLSLTTDHIKKLLKELLDPTTIKDILPILQGLTIKGITEIIRITTAQGGNVTVRTLAHNRSLVTSGVQGLCKVDNTTSLYIPNKELQDYVDLNKDYFLNKKTPLALVPRGILLNGLPGVGKCLDPKEPILMFNGSIKKTGALIVGDLLMGPDSTPRKILSTSTGSGRMYKITPIKGKPWRCNGEHILSLRKSCNPNKGLIKFVTVNEWFQWTTSAKAGWKLWRASVNFPERNAPKIDPYFMGVALGDGNLQNRINITTMDSEVVSEVYSIAASYSLEVRITTNLNSKASSYHLSTGNIGTKGIQCSEGKNKLLTLFQSYKLNVIGEEKFIPDDYKLGTRETRLQILAGLVDTDGYLINNCFEYSSKSLKLINDITFIARSLGFAAYPKKEEKECVNNGVWGTYYRVVISGNTSEIPTRVARRKARPRLMNKEVTNTGFSIEYDGEGDYFGIIIDGDHQYLLEDFTVTHNTISAKYISQVFEAPLYRLDLSASLSKFVGSSERNVATILAALEQEIACVCLLDEAEKLFGAGEDSGVTSRLLAQLLWFLQEHKKRIFTVITTNSLKTLPPELYRQGRIDQVLTLHPLNLQESYALAYKVAEQFVELNPPKKSILRDAIDKLQGNTDNFTPATITGVVHTIVKKHKWL